MEVKDAMENAEKIVAFGRVSTSLENLRKDIIGIKRVEEIMELLNENENILVLASGDPCFYGIVEYLKKKKINIEKIMPGISSFQYMMAKLGLSWQGANLISLHGRIEPLTSVKGNRLSIILTDSEKYSIHYI